MKRSSIDLFWKKVEKSGADACWVWRGAKNENNYGRVNIDGKLYFAHRFAWELANGRSVPDGLVIRHTCDNSLCCNPAHLLAGTQTENIRDMEMRERANRNGLRTRKFTKEQVLEIVKLNSDGAGKKAIGKMFGVSATCIMDILRGNAYRDFLDGVDLGGCLRNPHVKLSKDDANKIREFFAGGSSIKDIAKMYSVSHDTVRHVVRNLAWVDDHTATPEAQ